MEKCKICGHQKATSDFYLDSNGHRRKVCKVCHAQQKKDRQELAKHNLRRCKTCHEIKSFEDYGYGKQTCNTCKDKQRQRAMVDAEVKIEAKQYDWEDEYQRVLKNTTLDKGIGDKPFDYELKPNEKYKITTPSGYGDDVCIGRVVQTTENFFVIESDRKVRECFRYNDYKLGEYKIERC